MVLSKLGWRPRGDGGGEGTAGNVPGSRFCLCVGDDVSDEDMFLALKVFFKFAMNIYIFFSLEKYSLVFVCVSSRTFFSFFSCNRLFAGGRGGGDIVTPSYPCRGCPDDLNL